VRASSQTRALEEMFIRKKLPYKILNGAQFYSSEEIKTVLAYLRMVYAGNDLDFVWTIQRPRRGFGKKAMEALKAYAKQKNLSLLDALGEQIRAGLVKKQDVLKYYDDIRVLHRTYINYSCKDLVNKVLDCGYRQELQQDVNQNKIDNVAEFITAIAALEEENMERLSLEELLAHFALFSAQDDDTEKDLVKIMTIHTAKGLEFDTVFVNGLVDGQFPSNRLKNADELEEERRLCYVAITRAQKHLTISYARQRMLYGRTNAALPSRFLKEIPEHITVKRGGYVSREGYYPRSSFSYTSPDRVKTTSSAFAFSKPASVPTLELSKGNMVHHTAFGRGMVLSVVKMGSDALLEIAFDQIGTKKLMLKSASAHMKKL